MATEKELHSIKVVDLKTACEFLEMTKEQINELEEDGMFTPVLVDGVQMYYAEEILKLKNPMSNPPKTTPGQQIIEQVEAVLQAEKNIDKMEESFNVFADILRGFYNEIGDPEAGESLVDNLYLIVRDLRKRFDEQKLIWLKNLSDNHEIS